MIEPLELLARPDKWYLSAADGIIFAPRFPVWLDHPGFWDGATIYQYAFAPLFTVTVLDADGREVSLRAVSRRWTPAELTVEYRLDNGMTATEVRTVQPGGVFASEWRVKAMRATTLHLVAWTAQDVAGLDLAAVAYTGALTFTRTIRDRRDVPLAVTAELASVGGTTSWAAYLSDPVANQPHWRLTPFGERWRADGLPREVRLEGFAGPGLAYAAVHRQVEADPDGVSAAFALRLAPADPALRPADTARAPQPPAPTLGGASRRRWQELFARAPDFRCSDPYLEHYYWYRWYGLWLNAVAPGAGNYRGGAASCEGIDRFHEPHARSAPGHVRELRWLRTPDHARGILRTFFAHQRADGSLPGVVAVNHLPTTADAADAVADWGGALLALDAVWPDDAFVREMYPPLSRYATWLVGTYDPDETGLLDHLDQCATPGEESRPPLGADAEAGLPAAGGAPGPRLKGVDVTVYAYRLFRALESLAVRAGYESDVPRWCALAERSAAAVRSRMWDPAAEMFFPIDARTGERTAARAAVSFYPYLTDLVTGEHLPGLERHLFDPRAFWTAFPVPSIALDDPHFDANGERTGARRTGAWTGRSSPTINSHLVEALASTSAMAPHLRERAAQLLHRFIRTMFHDGDLARPNGYEHYSPLTGQASVWRGIDDHQHSWVADLVIGYVMGVRPHPGGITIDPFPFGVERAELTGVVARGRRVDVFIDGGHVTARVDREVYDAPLGEAIEVAG